MRVIAISDTHGMHEAVDIPVGDMIIHAGDFTKLGKEIEVHYFLDWFCALPHQHKILIAGNHDFLFEEHPRFAKSLIPQNIHYLKDSGITIDGIKIWGSPVQPRFLEWAFNRDRGADIDKHWKKIPKNTDILITHGPPAGILDKTIRGDSTGCADLLRHIHRVKLKFHIFGHIHEGYGVVKKAGTCFINASSADHRYKMVNKAVVFDFSTSSA